MSPHACHPASTRCMDIMARPLAKLRENQTPWLTWMKAKCRVAAVRGPGGGCDDGQDHDCCADEKPTHKLPLSRLFRATARIGLADPIRSL